MNDSINDFDARVLFLVTSATPYGGTTAEMIQWFMDYFDDQLYTIKQITASLNQWRRDGRVVSTEQKWFSLVDSEKSLPQSCLHLDWGALSGSRASSGRE
jgi:hypothetical protein